MLTPGEVLDLAHATKNGASVRPHKSLQDFRFGGFGKNAMNVCGRWNAQIELLVREERSCFRALRVTVSIPSTRDGLPDVKYCIA
jgi:hypothetical protein